MGKLNVFKITLGTGRIVLIREPKIRDQEHALQVASGRAKNDTMVGVVAQKELLKTLLVELDGKPLKATEKEDLDALFNFREYMQLQKALAEITGGEDLGNFQREIVTSGDK